MTAGEHVEALSLPLTVVSQRLTSLAPQSPHQFVNSCCFPWSQRFDHIFRKRESQSAIGTLVERQTCLAFGCCICPSVTATRSTMRSGRGSVSCRRGCGDRSRRTRAPRSHVTSRSPRRSAHRSTSATHDHHDSAARTRTPIASSVTTSPRAATCASTQLSTRRERAQQPPPPRPR